MKKIIVLLAVFCFYTASFASTGFTSAPKNANQMYIPVGKNAKISLMELSEIKVKDYEKLSGTHLNFFQRMTFKAGQKKLRNGISTDGTITNKKLLKAMSNGDPSVGFHLGGFALGFGLGLIGVLIAYIIKGDEDVDRNRRKWAWIGFGAYVVILLTIVVIVASSGASMY